jgi:hypothetical protein
MALALWFPRKVFTPKRQDSSSESQLPCLMPSFYAYPASMHIRHGSIFANLLQMLPSSLTSLILSFDLHWSQEFA